MNSEERREVKVPQSIPAKKPWKPPILSYRGDIAGIVRGGGGKLSPMGGDPGESRKQRGSG